jgi:radical SAM-linked protein
MPEDKLHRYRIRYSKGPLLRFIGHLDLLRTWERILRRAKVPIAYTQGFHPHPRINLGVALPLGFSSECELIDLWVEPEINSTELSSTIVDAKPPGIELHSVEEVDSSSPSLQLSIEYAEYQVAFEPGRPKEKVESSVEDLLAQTSHLRERRGKSYDLRPLINSITVSGNNGSITLKMRLSANQEGTGRPDEVLRALGFEPEKAQIIRTRLILTEERD